MQETPSLLAVREQYCALLIAQFRELRLTSLDDGAQEIRVPLEQVFVPLRAVVQLDVDADALSPEERRLLRLVEEAERQGRPLDDELREAYLQLDARRRERWSQERWERYGIGEALAHRSRALILLGDPGSGKSTLLHYLALLFARGAAAVVEHLGLTEHEAARLPILVPLASYDRALRAQTDLDLAAFLAHYYAEQHGLLGLAALFEDAIQSGTALLLLDGLDEVTDERRRAVVAAQAEALLRSATRLGNRAVLTSRIYGYRAAPLTNEWLHLTVLDFSAEEIALFTGQLLRALGQHDEAQQERVLAELKAHPAVARLAANPLLLTMLVLLQQQLGALPQGRIRLYDAYIGRLLGQWVARRGGSLPEDEQALIHLSLWMQQHRPSGTATRTELLRRLAEWYALQGRTAHEAQAWAERFLSDMARYDGLLIERGYDAYGFRHLTFQEYGAARALAQLPSNERWALVLPNLHSNRWSEPILFAVARLGISEGRPAEANAFVEAILHADSPYESLLHRDLLLVAACAAEDCGLDRALMQQLLTRMDELLRSPIESVCFQALQWCYDVSLMRDGERMRFPEALEMVQRQFLLDRMKAEDWYGGLSHQQRQVLQAFLAAYPAWRASVLARLIEATSSDDDVVADMLEPFVREHSEVRDALLAYVRRTPTWMTIRIIAPLFPDDAEVRAVLLDCVAHEQSYVRMWTFDEIGRFAAQDAEVRAALLRGLDDSSVYMRGMAIKQLGKLAGHDDEVRAVLLAHLADESYEMTFSLIAALGPHIARDDVRDALLVYLERDGTHEQTELVQHLGSLLPQYAAIRERVLDLLRTGDAWLRSEVVKVLAPLLADHADVRAALQTALHDRESNVRREAIWALTPYFHQFPELLADVEAIVEHPDQRTRSAVLDALPIRFRGAVLTNPHCFEAGEARAAALLAFGRLTAEDSALLPHVRAYLSDVHPAVWAAAVSVLAPFAQHDEALHADLVALLQENEPTLLQAIEQKVDWLVSYAAPLRSALLAQVTTHNMFKREIVSKMLHILAERDAETRQVLIDVVARGPSPLLDAALGALLPLSLEDLDVRQAILPYLSDYSFHFLWLDKDVLSTLAVEDRAVRAILLSRLDHPGKASRSYLISILSALAADNDVRARLLLYLGDDADEDAPENYVCMEAANALAPLVPHDAEVRAALLTCMPKQRGIALESMMRALQPLMQHDAEVRAALLAYLEHTDGDLRSTAVYALGEALAEDVTLRPLLMNCLTDPDLYVRAAAISALASRIITDTEVRATIVAHLTDSSEYVRFKALDAVQPLVLGDAEIRAAAIARLDDSDNDVRRAAIEALLPCCEQDRELALRLLPALPSLSDHVAGEQLCVCIAGWLTHDVGLRERLIGWLSEHDWRVRAAAAQVLSIADLAFVREARSALEAALHDWRGEEALEAQLQAAELLLNTYHWSEQALAVVLRALNYQRNALFMPEPESMDSIRSQAALVLGKLQAEYRTPELLAHVEYLLRTEQEPELRNSLYHALSSLVAAPAADDRVS